MGKKRCCRKSRTLWFCVFLSFAIVPSPSDLRCNRTPALFHLLFKESETLESDNKVKNDSEAPKIEDSSEIKPPALHNNTPRIHDVAKENLNKEADKENKRFADDDVFVEEKEVRKKKVEDEDVNKDKKEEQNEDEVHTEPFCLFPTTTTTTMLSNHPDDMAFVKFPTHSLHPSTFTRNAQGLFVPLVGTTLGLCQVPCFLLYLGGKN